MKFESEDYGDQGKTWTKPPLNWFGGYMVARELLLWTKAGVEFDDKDGFIAKLNRENFISRAIAITGILNRFGPTVEAAKTLQGDGKGFFTDVSEEALVEKIQEAIENLQSGGLYKFRDGEFGSLDFTDLPEDDEDNIL